MPLSSNNPLEPSSSTAFKQLSLNLMLHLVSPGAFLFRPFVTIIIAIFLIMVLHPALDESIGFKFDTQIIITVK
jgi:hypothetical protein